MNGSRIVAACAVLATVAALLSGTSAGATPANTAPDTVSSAGIDQRSLGGRYTASGVTFRVFSAAATRMRVDVYAAPTGTAAANFPLTKGADQVWSVAVSTAQLQAAGVTGTVYYGYRAWGPNWPYTASWNPGSAAGFVADVDAAGNRFNPNKLLARPVRAGDQPRPAHPGQPGRRAVRHRRRQPCRRQRSRRAEGHRARRRRHRNRHQADPPAARRRRLRGQRARPDPQRPLGAQRLPRHLSGRRAQGAAAARARRDRGGAASRAGDAERHQRRRPRPAPPATTTGVT